MKTAIKVVVVLLLLFNGIGALYGGYNFITDPSGGKMQIPLSYLEHSPFKDYLIPGIVLFCVNGLLSMLTIGAIILKLSVYPLLVMLQGLLLGGWIVVQMILLQTFFAPLHVPFLLIGLTLMVLGYKLQLAKSCKY